MRNVPPQVSKSLNARLVEAQIARTKALAKREDIRNRKIAGDLIERRVVESEWFTLTRQVRDALQNIAPRIAGLVASEKKQDKCFAIIEKEIRQALEGLNAGGIGGTG